MKLSAYYQRIRLWNPTGVGKHIASVTKILSSEFGSVTHIHGIDDYYRACQLAVPNVRSPDTLHVLPIPRRVLEGCWSTLDGPSIERFSGQCDWIYCPAEYYVSRSSARLAVTIHCDNWFNEELPWYGHKDTVAVRRKRRKLYETIAKKADRLLCVSQFLKDRMVKSFGISEHKISVVGNGVENSFFSPGDVPEKLRNQIDGRPYACVIGGLTRRKGGSETLEIISEMSKRDCRFIFVIIGSSESQFKARVSSLNNVIEAGYVGVDSGLPGLVARATAVLFLSRYETFGIPAIESMAAGTVPIVSRFGALPEVVGEHGVIVDPEAYGEVPSILASLVKYPPSSDKRGDLRSRAKEFSWDSCCKKIIKALNE